MHTGWYVEGEGSDLVEHIILGTLCATMSPPIIFMSSLMISKLKTNTQATFSYRDPKDFNLVTIYLRTRTNITSATLVAE